MSTKLLHYCSQFLCIGEPDRSLSWLSYKVHCFPLYSILTAVNVSAVDYLSLDVDGSELDVLKTIPFDSILIKVTAEPFKTIHNCTLCSCKICLLLIRRLYLSDTQ